MRNLINKYKSLGNYFKFFMILCNKQNNKTGKVSDHKRTQRKKRLITRRGLIAVNQHLLKKGQHTAQSFKTDLM